MNKISTPLGVAIIIAIALIVGGGVLAYQYWWLPKQEVESSIKVISPNGGESWEIGKTYSIKWNTANLTSKQVNISLFKDGVFNREIFSGALSQSGEIGSFDALWIVPHDLSIGGGYTIQIVDSASGSISGDFSRYDFSDAPFSIVAIGNPSITLLSPNGRETWAIGSMQTIRWSGNNLGPSYELGSGECTGASTTINKCFEWAHRIKAVNLKSSSGQVTPLISGERTDVGSLNIAVPSVTLGLYTVEIIASSEYGYNVSDMSDTPISIVAADTPSITVLSPNGGEEFKVGDTISIRWSYANGVWVDGYIYRTSGGQIYQFCEFGSCVDIQRDPFGGSASVGQKTISLKNFTAANDYRIHLNLSSEGDRKVAEDDSDAAFSIK